MGLFVLVLLWCASDTLASRDEVDAWRSMQLRRATPDERPRMMGRIFGGIEANIMDVPYQLSLRRFDSHICGASVVDRSLAITAAHCVTPKPSPDIITLKGGSTNRTDDAGEIFVVIEIIRHPTFNSNTYHNDVALIRIEGTFDGLDNIAPIALHTQPIYASNLNPIYCSVSGWGLTNMNRDSLPEMLRIVQIPLVPYTECRRRWSPFPITTSMTCAGEWQKDACNGDSGGPLVCNNQLYGIVSWGSSQCGSSYPGVYTAIPAKEVIAFLNKYIPEPQTEVV
uniref:Peptidase S1 domain-containing protein n=1 Tax=Anopheles christyi TaxID=43041 RepID=A0A240PK25_9DIPT